MRILIKSLFVLIFIIGCEKDNFLSNKNDFLKSFDSGKLIDTTWHLQSITTDDGTVTISDNDTLSIRFFDDGSIEGFGGSNTFYGQFEYDEMLISISPKGMSYAAILPPDSKVFDFWQALEEAYTYQTDGEKLFIQFDGRENNRMIFIAD